MELMNMPDDSIMMMLDEFNPIELLDLRNRNIAKELNRTVDDKLRELYLQIYNKNSEGDIKDVILELKQALFPQFRQDKSKFHTDYFGNPDGDNMNENIFKWADVVLTHADKNELIHIIGTDVVLEEYWANRDTEVSAKMNELYDKFLNWSDSWIVHIKNKDDVYEFLEQRIPSLAEELEGLVEWLTLFADNVSGSFNDLAESYSSISENDLRERILLEMKSDELLTKYISIVINENSNFKVGDYFYHYYFHNKSRQSYGIGSVGYDITQRKKIPIFDGEGMPEFPKWMLEQFERINLDYTYPEDEIREYLGNY